MFTTISTEPPPGGFFYAWGPDIIIRKDYVDRDWGVSAMIGFPDFEAVALKHLHAELDTAPMTMVHPRLPDIVECSMGRMFLQHCRQINRDVASGAQPPLLHDRGRFEDVMQASVAMMSDYIGTYHYELVEILDWLLLAGAEQHPWLENVDALGRPKKLMKCQSIEALYNESVKCMRGRQPTKKSADDLTAKDERHVTDIGLGYSVVELLSPDALDVESTRMLHCVGNGSFDSKLGTPGYTLLSIRDPDQIPRATIELVSRTYEGAEVPSTFVRQFLGPKNSQPEAYLVELFNAAAESILCHEVRSSPPAPSRSAGRF